MIGVKFILLLLLLLGFGCGYAYVPFGVWWLQRGVVALKIEKNLMPPPSKKFKRRHLFVYFYFSVFLFGLFSSLSFNFHRYLSPFYLFQSKNQFFFVFSIGISSHCASSIFGF